MAKTHKTAELEGSLLDAAVALAEGWRSMPGGQGYAIPSFGVGLAGGEPIDTTTWEPRPRAWSTDWRHGGPIIERERIAIDSYGVGAWMAHHLPSFEVRHVPHIEGRTPLIAAMRAYVASKFGDTMDLP